MKNEWLKWRNGREDNPIQILKKIIESSMAIAVDMEQGRFWR